jgi:hypothetical protein
LGPGFLLLNRVAKARAALADSEYLQVQFRRHGKLARAAADISFQKKVQL